MNLGDLFWVAGSLCSGLAVLYGAYLAVDFHFRTTSALQHVIARLALYEWLGHNGLVHDAKEEMARTIVGPVHSTPVS